MSGTLWPLFGESPLSESPLKGLEKILGCNWKNIDGARQNTQTTLQQLSEIIEGLPGPDASVVVLGSLGRLECTQGSDLDWTLLVDGQADASDHWKFLDIKNALSGTDFEDLGLKKPGPEGTFGNLTFSQPIYALHRW